MMGGTAPGPGRCTANPDGAGPGIALRDGADPTGTRDAGRLDTGSRETDGRDTGGRENGAGDAAGRSRAGRGARDRDGHGTDRPVVAVTRPEPQASGTARRLAALGYTPLVAPLLQVVPVTADGTEAGEGPGSANGIGTLALTSRTAALILAAHPAFHSLPVAAVGSATAAEARRAGFTRVDDAAGTVDVLLDRLAGAPEPIVHMAGREHTGDLVERLVARGQRASRRIVYAMAPQRLPAAPRVDAVLIYSPRTAHVFSGEVTRAADSGDAAQGAGTSPWDSAAVVAMSDKVAAAMPGRLVCVASAPTEPAMLEALAAILPSPASAFAPAARGAGPQPSDPAG